MSSCSRTSFASIHKGKIHLNKTVLIFFLLDYITGTLKTCILSRNILLLCNKSASSSFNGSISLVEPQRGETKVVLSAALLLAHLMHSNGISMKNKL